LEPGVGGAREPVTLRNVPQLTDLTIYDRIPYFEMRFRFLFLALTSICGLPPAFCHGLPDSVAKFLQKPRSGQASITLGGGTKTEGFIQRVTDEFIALQLRSGVCENVPVADIAEINIVRKGRVRDAILDTLMIITLSPEFLDYGLAKTDSKDPLFGNWESSGPGANGKTIVHRIEFTQYGSVLQGSGNITRRDLTIETGTYTVNPGVLYLSFASGINEAVSLRFECDAILADKSTRIHRLLLRSPKVHRAAAPIVGEWVENGSENTWDFEANGGFTLTTTERHQSGSFFDTKAAIKVAVPGTMPEDWQYHFKGSHLIVANAGTSTEYKRTKVIR
jgi:hypothetical protein